MDFMFSAKISKLYNAGNQNTKAINPRRESLAQISSTTNNIKTI